MYYIHILGKVRGFFAHLVEKNIGGVFYLLEKKILMRLIRQ